MMIFIENNQGKGKIYPGGPTCIVKGVKVPFDGLKKEG